MKVLYTTLVVLLYFMWCAHCYGQAQKLYSVRVEFEGFDTETFVDVNCEQFDSSFKKTKKIKIFYNKPDLSKFELLLKDFKPATKQSLDVRGKIIYTYGKTPVKYCFTVFGCFYKEGKLYYNKKLLMLISDKIYGNHPEYLDTLRQP